MKSVTKTHETDDIVIVLSPLEKKTLEDHLIEYMFVVGLVDERLWRKIHDA